jgi:hypothetical protein
MKVGQFLPERWFIFMYVLLVFPVAAGIFKVASSFKKQKSVIFLLVLLFISFYNLTNQKSDIENNFQEFIPVDYGIKESEVCYITWMYTNTNENLFLNSHLYPITHIFDEPRFSLITIDPNLSKISYKNEQFKISSKNVVMNITNYKKTNSNDIIYSNGLNIIKLI